MQFRPSPLLQSHEPDDASAGGGFSDTPEQGAPEVVQPQDTTTTPAPEQGATGGPKDMLEAMFGQSKPATAEETAEAAAAGKTIQQLRDEKGRFAGKAPETDPTKPAAKPGDKPDPNAMPEGLTPKAQERFQALANTNRELTARVSEWQPIVNSAMGLQQIFHHNGVRQDQFTQAMEVVGLMNKGDLRGALAALDEQRKMISLHLGENLPGANALSDYPDLQAEVDNLQITEARALELARGRMQQGARQQAQQVQQRDEQTQDQEQKEFRNGQLAVDKVCQRLAATDLDFRTIEPMLIEQVKGGLLEGIPAARWPALVEKTYAVIKQTAAQSRMGGATTPVLRPTGLGEGVKQQPKTMYEAMFGAAKPAGA